MQAVILAAGRGTRMGSLTETVPKPMLHVAGKTLLQHKFDILRESVSEIVVVVGYLKEVIESAYGHSYQGVPLTYVVQDNIVGGTADALWAARPFLKDRFFVLMGDDLYVREDLLACEAHEWALLVQRMADVGTRGKVQVDDSMNIVSIVESNEHEGGEGYAGTNLFMLDTRIFEYPSVPKSRGSSEVGLPQTVCAAAEHAGIPFRAVEATRWHQITAPEDLAIGEEFYRGKK
jgi:UDP-N-acetylglucosamine diphosphorylase / glucose-1-phosphate thymidylyltransferase / UDP-N-acetylgalactosamine diphosphorylase / glucosamine-1-phosphate N-acetyltransferase / galactosamine-1-phosphate N-acetyltransferase